MPCEKPSLLETDTMAELVNKLLVNSRKLVKCNNKHRTLIQQIRAAGL